MTQQWRVIADKSFILTAALTNSSAACSSGQSLLQALKTTLMPGPRGHREIGTIDLPPP
jgi:hypothetical protein